MKFSLCSIRTEARLRKKLIAKYPSNIHTRAEPYNTDKIFEISYFYC